MKPLSRADLTALRPKFELEFTADSTLAATIEDLTHWSLVAHYLTRDPAMVDDTDLDDDQEFWRVPVFWMQGVSLGLWRPAEPFAELLDAESADYAEFVPLVDGNDLSDELSAVSEFGTGDQLVIIDRAFLHPRWRGHGIGRLIIGSAITEHLSAARCVATLPCPTELLEEFGQNRDHPRFVTALASVRRTWESIGFFRFTDDVWVKDPAMTAGDSHLRELRERILGR